MSNAAATTEDFGLSDADGRSLSLASKGLLGGHVRPFLGGSQAWSSTSDAAQSLDRFSDVGVVTSRYVSPLVETPELPRMDSAVVLQKWEGRVDQLLSDSFTATLADLTNRGAVELASFPLSEVSRHDLALVVPGAVFYWSVGYRDAVSGQRTHESVLRFRRLPRWSPADRREAAELADS